LIRFEGFEGLYPQGDKVATPAIRIIKNALCTGSFFDIQYSFLAFRKTWINYLDSQMSCKGTIVPSCFSMVLPLNQATDCGGRT